MPSKHKGNKSAEKKTRKIELSYFHQDIKTKTIKQVRKNSGGGTRSMEVIKTTTMQQLLEKAKQLYFTDGESCRGMLTDFNVKLSDVNFCDVKDDATVESYYDRQKMRLLRFYFIASFKDEESEDESGNTCSQSETNKLPVRFLLKMTQVLTSHYTLLYPKVSQALGMI
ncbi:hypothetical protein KUTeg_004682 [Tegillarca granosa]|uniref:Uncharacterized protein n=1 Tax=Tegillarca granosa TaxID=220873 RepID=A0ABQ9FKF3_TEGGR|nr:hypothetical protein KUTeg_004682 [Tegillarca granosa]